MLTKRKRGSIEPASFQNRESPVRKSTVSKSVSFADTSRLARAASSESPTPSSDLEKAVEASTWIKTSFAKIRTTSSATLDS